MYFDLAYIRRFLGVAIRVLLYLGAVILGVGVILTFAIQIEDDSKYTAIRIVNGLRYINQTVFVIGLTLVICGLIGYLSTKINNDITVGLFAAISFIIFISVLLFTIGFVALIIVHQSVKVDRHACINSEFFQTAQRLFLEASRYYGSSKCMTNIDDTTLFITDPEFNEHGIQIDKKNGYSSVLGCPNYFDLLENLRLDRFSEEPQYIGSLEITFQCSGICTSHPIYVFSDVNRGPPIKDQGCFHVVVDYIDKVGLPILGILWVITCLLLMVLINSVCLFFHPKRYDDFYMYKPLHHQDETEQNQQDVSVTQVDVNDQSQPRRNLKRRDTSDIATHHQSTMHKRRDITLQQQHDYDNDDDDENNNHDEDNEDNYNQNNHLDFPSNQKKHSTKQ